MDTKLTERTTQQQNFITAVLEAARAGGGRHICLRARAGTGKTATLIELVDDYTREFPAHELTLCAYNKAAADEIKARLERRGHKDWKQVAASTVHALGFGLLRYMFKPTVDDKKVIKLIDAQNDPSYAENAVNIARLVSLAKLEGFGFFPDANVGDKSAWYRIADHYDVNGFDDTTTMDLVVEAAQRIYTLSLAQTDVVDFDDMVLLPLVKNLRVRFQRDLLVVDEAQDTGRARQALLRKFVKPRGVMIVVGDDRQGIYGFAGAQADALEQLILGMRMATYPLTVSWRCPRAVIAEAQRIVPDIEAAPGAAQGEVLQLGVLPDELAPTDAILCRNTAPLVEAAYALLRRGVACRVEGREIGTGLLRMVNRWRVQTIDGFLRRLEDYRAREVQKATARGNDSKVAEVNDRCDTLVHLCNVCLERRQTDLEDVRRLIDSMFGDDVAASGVLTLATYHRSKGREWPRVMLLQHHQRCPSPWAHQDWQRRQEDNLAYVAITRAQRTLAYVG
jgi:superfamily I DNA/RNA helicase